MNILKKFSLGILKKVLADKIKIDLLRVLILPKWMQINCISLQMNYVKLWV